MTETLPSSQPSLRVTVVQIGARRNYAVPIALQQAGMLERFFTDWYGPKSFFTKLSGSVSAVIPWKALKRAKARQASELPLEKVVHFPTFALAYNWRKAAASRKGAKAFAYIWGGREFCTRVLSYGLPSCDAVFCFSSVAKELFEAVSGKRLLRVLDQGIPPLAYDDRLVREQETAYPEWCLPRSVESGVEEYTERQRQEWHAADLILCPSTFCRRALVAERAPAEKIEMLPFGIHPKFFVGERSRATNGRTFTVLFVANTPVRKGLPDLVVALERLKGKSIEAFVIGSYTDLTPYALQRTQRVARVLGNVPRPSMPEWYRKADVLVLPTVSDTFAAVVLEAMAAGLPVITTPNCGTSDAIRDGTDGFIVPVRSPEVIAEKIDLLASDRELLRWMSENARQRAQEYSLDKYRQRLVKVLYKAIGANDS